MFLLGGACGYENTYQAGFGVYTTALSGALFRGGEACGACYQVMCNSRLDRRWCLPRASVTVTTTNFYPPNHHGGWCDRPPTTLTCPCLPSYGLCNKGTKALFQFFIEGCSSYIVPFIPKSRHPHLFFSNFSCP
mgnify:CR=1 FL=1